MDHGVVSLKAELSAVLCWREVVGGVKVALQHLVFGAANQTNDCLGLHGRANRYGRLPLRFGWSRSLPAKAKQRRVNA